MPDEKKSCEGCKVTNCQAKKRAQGETREDFEERQALMQNLCGIRHKVMVLSGKGGVGKSTVAANLALAVSMRGLSAGLMDVDIHGPSIPRIMGLEGSRIEVYREKMLPVPINENLKAMSIGLLLRGKEEAVIWRGPLKMGVIKQFLRDVEWGVLDFLVIDSPPGTGDEPLSVIQLVPDLDGAVIVTTPQDLSLIDVRRSIMFCRTVNLPVLGVIENMSGFVCPHCGKSTEIFKSGGGEKMAAEMDVPFLGRIPIDPAVTEASDRGEPYLSAFEGSETARAFSDALSALLDGLEQKGD